MKKIFLDLGCNKLQGLYNFFINKLGIDESWVIRCFEANKTVYEQAIIIKQSKNNSGVLNLLDFKIINAAISDKNGIEKIKNIIEYTTSKNNTYEGDAGGSTCLNDIIWHQKNVKFEISEVCSIDINTLIEDIVQEYGKEIEIYIKCDIEGYEYKVISKLCSSQFLNKIKQIYIEWHPHFFENQIYKKAEAYNLIHCLYSKGLQEVFMYD